MLDESKAIQEKHVPAKVIKETGDFFFAFFAEVI